jgi:hypothetical protein
MWSIWLLIGLGNTLMDLQHYTQYSGNAAGWSHLIFLWRDIGIRAAGVVLSGLLLRNPNRAIAITLAAVSLFALWIFYIGFFVFSILGGESSATFIADWWNQNTRSIWIILRVFSFGAFFSVSVITWPLYAIVCTGGKSQHKTPS